MRTTPATVTPELATSGRQKVNFLAEGDPDPKAFGEHLRSLGYILGGSLNCYPDFESCAWDAYDDPCFVEIDHDLKVAIFLHV